MNQQSNNTLQEFVREADRITAGVVVDVASRELLIQHVEDNMKARRALRAIQLHCEVMSPKVYRILAPWMIATEALNGSDKP